MKKVLLILLVILFSGCSNYNDIKNIAVVSSIGIKLDEDKYKMYIKVLSSNQENEETIYDEVCTSLDQCFDSLNSELMKRLYLTHLDLLILGNNLQKENYDDIFNFFLSDKSSRNSFSTIIVDELESNIFDYDTEDIQNMLTLSSSTNALTKNVLLSDIIKDVLNYSVSYVPYITTSDELQVKGYKAVYEENKLLNKDESIAINLIQNNIKTFSVIIDNNIHKLESCITNTDVKNNNITINVSCKYYSNSDNVVSKIEENIKNKITMFIDNNITNYFDYLIYKYENKKFDNKNYEIIVNIDYQEENGGDIFE